MAQYERPEQLDKALALMEEHGEKAKVYAGGTDLLVQFRENPAARPELLVDVTTIPELQVLELRDGFIRLGAAVTHARAAKDEMLRRHASFLCAACQSVGSPQIRNTGTVGGNICNGSLAADCLPVLCALGAELELHSSKGARRLPIETAYLGKGMDIAPDEVLVALTFPVPQGYRLVFEKLGRRKALAISRMNVAVMLKIRGNVIEDVRIAPGCVFRTPQRARAAEDFLRGKAISETLFKEAGRLVSKQMIESTGVRWSTEYKQPVLGSMVARCLERAVEAQDATA